ncbi:MAG: hypothetical protein ACFHWX_16630 [Bacteroidota bacterium]
MRSVVFTLLISFSLLFSVQAQYREPSQGGGNNGGGGLASKFYYGGGGGFSGGSNYINVSLSPLIGYKITERFSGGLQFSYQYVRLNSYRSNNYGGGPFLRLNITQKFFAYTQYEYMNYGLLTLPPDKGPRYDFRSLFVGLGYSEPIGKNFAFNITALYNLLYKDGSQSPYNSPLMFRVGIVAGLF